MALLLFKVVSNFLQYGDNEQIIGFQDKTIDVFSKNEYALEGTEYYKLIENRDNVILLGDSIGDAGMADGMPHCNAVLKIGFLYDHVNNAKCLEKNACYFYAVLDY